MTCIPKDFVLTELEILHLHIESKNLIYFNNLCFNNKNKYIGMVSIFIICGNNSSLEYT